MVQFIESIECLNVKKILLAACVLLGKVKKFLIKKYYFHIFCIFIMIYIMTIINKIVKNVTLIRWLYVIIILLVKILQYKKCYVFNFI